MEPLAVPTDPAGFPARANEALLEQQYLSWKTDPRSVSATWASFFEGFELGCAREAKEAGSPSAGSDATGHTLPEEVLGFRAKVAQMIHDFRALGHTGAWLDPLKASAPDSPYLQSSRLGFVEADLVRPIATGQWRQGARMTLAEMMGDLRRVYCGHIGFEFMHIHKPEVRDWLRDRIENRFETPDPAMERRKAMLHWLMEAELFERFLHRKYVGQKRFSLEGGESLVVALHTILEHGSTHQLTDMVMGMAHRGRLTVLANFVDKPLSLLFREFSENYLPDAVAGDGDVKYHLGYENTPGDTLSGGKIRIHLAANPSHLEAVDPVVEGKTRAKQRLTGDIPSRKQVLPLLIHGDAAFAGQGIVAEVLNLSQLTGYRTGGTIHIVVNNQIGFTTTPEDARSSDYCTDVAKMIDAPVFHVNGDHPEEVAFVAALALDFRQRFSRDVVLDIVCYRRHGHNEGDEPSFTQPKTTRLISQQTPVAQLYRKQLVENRVLTEQDAQEMEAAILRKLEAGLQSLDEQEKPEDKEAAKFAGSTAVIQPPYSHDFCETGLPLPRLRELGQKLLQVPESFHLNEVIRKRFLGARQASLESGRDFDWAHAEALAFASLLSEGNHVRLSGQDVRRGTFSQRHCVLYDASNRERYIPLQNLGPNQAAFSVYNSLLSEAAVLGFEYGYSTIMQEALVIWEAQFGDFVNGAQVIIDQFICAAETKWGTRSGVVLLLPHGYEGQGPEHSSARLERFLQLCANDNIQVAHLTTPAQYFHILRRQVKRDFLKPLVLMTPKSLLRHPGCVSSLNAMGESTGFQEILDDTTFSANPSQVKRVILCTGKVYFDLLQEREARKEDSTAIIRIEQLHPFDSASLASILARYDKREDIVWSQEEPRNMGAWTFIQPLLDEAAGEPVRYAGRSASASTAAGTKALHTRQLKLFLAAAFGQTQA